MVDVDVDVDVDDEVLVEDVLLVVTTMVVDVVEVAATVVEVVETGGMVVVLVVDATVVEVVLVGAVVDVVVIVVLVLARVEVVEHCDGRHASAQFSRGPQPAKGSNGSRHFSASFTEHVTTPFLFTVRQST